MYVSKFFSWFCVCSSYLHCRWADLEELEKDKRIHQKVKRFKAKQAHNNFLTEVSELHFLRGRHFVFPFPWILSPFYGCTDDGGCVWRQFMMACVKVVEWHTSWPLALDSSHLKETFGLLYPLVSGQRSETVNKKIININLSNCSDLSRFTSRW